MTRAQFSRAINADEKWVENSARLLKRTLRYTPAEARWMGLVRVLVQEVHLPLVRADEIADRAMRLPVDARSVNAEEGESGSAAIVLDMARYHSSHAASLSAALNLVEPGKRGRPRRRVRPSSNKSTTLLRAARVYGVDVQALRYGRRDSHDTRLRRLNENASFIGAMRKSASGK